MQNAKQWFASQMQLSKDYFDLSNRSQQTPPLLVLICATIVSVLVFWYSCAN